MRTRISLRRGWPRLLCLAVITALSGLVLAPGTAIAAHPHPRVVSEQPDADTAELVSTSGVPRPRPDALATSNDRVYLGGVFEAIEDDSGVHNRANVASVNESTGQVLPFAPELNGAVDALVAQGDSLYVGGRFTSVNGVNSSHVVLLDVATGDRVESFRPVATNGTIQTLALHEDRLYVGGNFQRAGGVDHAGFTAFGPITGDLDPFVGAGFRTPQRHRHRSPRTGLTQ